MSQRPQRPQRPEKRRIRAARPLRPLNKHSVARGRMVRPSRIVACRPGRRQPTELASPEGRGAAILPTRDVFRHTRFLLHAMPGGDGSPPCDPQRRGHIRRSVRPRATRSHGGTKLGFKRHRLAARTHPICTGLCIRARLDHEIATLALCVFRGPYFRLTSASARVIQIDAQLRPPPLSCPALTAEMSGSGQVRL
jgi:hypothetical protein